MILYTTKLDSPEVRDGMAVRTNNCLRWAGYHTVGEVCLLTREDLRRTRNFGKRALEDVERFLEENGLHLGMSRDELREVPEDIFLAVSSLDDIIRTYRTIASELDKRLHQLVCLESVLKEKYLIE